MALKCCLNAKGSDRILFCVRTQRVLYGNVIKYLSIYNPVEMQCKLHIAGSKEILKQFLPAHLREAKTRSCL